jgi:Flp pilus assembly protein TadG
MSSPHPNRPSRRSAKGQAMAIFALVAVLLFVVAGLSIDAGTSYLTSNRIERAAAAAALAGVAYLPGDYPDAQNAALVEAARDGFANGGSGGGVSCVPANVSPCVVTSQPQTNELKVTISASVSTIFLRIVGFGSHTVVRSETAQYLPPISLGQPGSQQGADLSTLGVTGYFERQEGYGNPRSEGDAFTPSPAQGNNGCGPSGTDNCSAASSPDFHSISAEAGTENPIASIEYQGGSNYLIDLPPQTSADVQVYNPSFAPDACDGSHTSAPYCYHEDDGSFAGTGAACTAYSAMAYTLFQVPTLSSRLGDVYKGQEVFLPYNATNLTASTPNYVPIIAPSCPGAPPAAVNYTPATYHQWISALTYNPPNPNDKALYNGTGKYGATLSNPAALGSPDVFYRLEVDTLQWNGQPFCPGNSGGPCAYPNTSPPTVGQSQAHKGYAVRLVTPGQASCTSACGTISAMDDMTVFTPVNGASSPQFAIPLFSVDPTAYAGQTINVDLFDVGDVGGGAAYVGLREPDGTTWATANTITDLGADLAGSNPPSSGGNVSSLVGGWPVGGNPCSACYQTAGGGGGAIYQGQWVQMQIQIPPSFTGPGGAVCGTSNCYWSLVYDVSAAATAGDTFSVEVGFDGSPDHLLP